MDLAVIIPARNEEHRLGAQLDALVAQSWDTGEWEIIVVDNGSTDGTADLVRQYARRHSRIRLLSAPERADQSFAANAGVAATDASAVAFCDADDVVMEGWVEAMGVALRDHQVVTGPNELDRLNPPWLASSRGRSAVNSVGSFVGIFPVVRGNNYGVRKDVWTVTGPLNEGFFPVADIEFSYRCWIHGIAIFGEERANVHYRYRTNWRDLWRQGWRYGTNRPMIARLLKDSGRPTPRLFGGWRSWVLLIVTLPRTLTRRGRAAWLWVAANRLGQLVGSVRHRVVML